MVSDCPGPQGRTYPENQRGELAEKQPTGVMFGMGPGIPNHTAYWPGVTPGDDYGIPTAPVTEHGGWDREQAARNVQARRRLRLAVWARGRRVDHRPGHYYVSAVSGGRVALLAGPFRWHKQARRWVRATRGTAEAVDDYACFYAYGTLRLDNGERRGVLNDKLGITPYRKEARPVPVVPAMRRKHNPNGVRTMPGQNVKPVTISSNCPSFWQTLDKRCRLQYLDSCRAAKRQPRKGRR